MHKIAVDKVRKQFDSKVAVDGVSFQIPSGQVFGLLGPNEAGKTTLIRMLMDIIKPDSGSILYEGRPLTSKDKDRITYLPEERGLYRKEKVRDVLEYFGNFAGVTGFAVSYFFTILFMLSIIGTAGYLLQGVAEEKENRVIEILLSSVTTNQLLAGKILGLCAAGLTQILVWVLIGVGPSIFILPFLELRWAQLFVALLFFLLGFLLFAP